MRRLIPISLLGLVAAILSGCAEVTQIVPPSGALYATVQVTRQEVPDRPFVGLVLEEALAASLDELEFLEGLSVAEVDPGSPAEALGIQVGDVVLSADGVELLGVDQWEAVLDGKQAGDRLELTVERDSGVVDVELEIANRGGGELPTAARFAEHRRLRCVLATVVEDSTVDGTTRTAAEVIEIQPGSPLPSGNVVVGDRIIGLNGEPIGGASELLARIATLSFGEVIELDVIDRDGQRRAAELALWEPERELTRLSFPILFSYHDDLEVDRTRFALLDFWVLALYDYQREASSTRHRFLRFFQFETGTGDLTQLPTKDPEQP